MYFFSYCFWLVYDMQSGNMKLSSVPSCVSAVSLSTSSVCFAILEEQGEQEALCHSMMEGEFSQNHHRKSVVR